VTRVVWAPQAIEDVETVTSQNSSPSASSLGYRIVYRRRADTIEVVTVFHGARLLRLD